MTTPQPEAPRPSIAGLPLAVEPAATLPFTDAFLVDHYNMSPLMARGSIAFLAGRAGYVCEGVYFFPTLGPGDLRRVQARSRGYLLSMDNWPHDGKVVSRDRLNQLAPRQVVGVARPYTAEFAEFLRTRFPGAIQ